MDRETARTLLEESRRHMDAILRAVEEADRKAIELVKIDGVALGLVATALGLAAGARVAWPILVAGALGIACLLASLTLAVVALYRRDVALGVIDLAEGVDLRYAETLAFTLEIHQEAVEANRAALNAKGRLIVRGASLLLLAALLLGGSAIALIVQEGVSRL